MSLDIISQVVFVAEIFAIACCYGSILFFGVTARILYVNRKRLYFVKRGLLFLVLSWILTSIFLIVFLPIWILEEYINERDYGLSLMILVIIVHCLLVGIIDITVSRIFYYFIQITRTDVANNQLKRMSIQLSVDFDEIGMNDMPACELTPCDETDTEMDTSNMDVNDGGKARKPKREKHKRGKNRKNRKNGKNDKKDDIDTFTGSNFSHTIATMLEKQRNKLFIFRYYWLFGTPFRLTIVMTMVWLFENLLFICIAIDLPKLGSNVRYIFQIALPLTTSFIKGILVLTVIKTKYKLQISKINQDTHWGIIKEFYNISRLISILAFIAIVNFIFENMVNGYYPIAQVLLMYLMISFMYGLNYCQIIWVTKINNIEKNKNGQNSNNRLTSLIERKFPYLYDNETRVVETAKSNTVSPITIVDSNMLRINVEKSTNEYVGIVGITPDSTVSNSNNNNNNNNSNNEIQLTDLGSKAIKVATPTLVGSNSSNLKSLSFGATISSVTDENEKQSKNNNIKVTRLSNFWDATFDIVNNYNYVRNEFLLFIDHCTNELCMENLLFWVNILQLLQFLIEFKYISIKTKQDVMDFVKPLNETFQTSHHIKDTIFMESLRRLHYRSQIKNSNKSKFSNEINDNRDSITIINNLDYSIFRLYYKDIFREFLQRDYAPFELNISHELRERFTKYYDDARMNPNLWKSDSYFKYAVWADLKEASISVYSMLNASFRRFLVNRQA